MNWTDRALVPERTKVARLESASNLLACSGPIALFPAGTVAPPLRQGVWVTGRPMTETVKRVDDAGMVTTTVPRDGLRVVGYPVVIPASLAQQASDPNDLLRRALASGEARELE